YFGISTTSFSSSTIAWHDSRETGVNPHARSSRSSSSSDDSDNELKPSRTMTWQVVQAQDFSQACSTSIPCSRRLSSSDMHFLPSKVLPPGQISGCGRTTISVIVIIREPLNNSHAGATGSL